MASSGDRCAWPRCVSAPAVGWLGRLLCKSHWEGVCRLTSSGPDGFLEAYGTLKVPKRLWAKASESTKKHDGPDDGGYGELPDPDEFSYDVP